MGAAMLCRPTPLSGFPILVAALVFVGRRRPVRVRLLHAALLTLATILVIGPWILRIHSSCGVWVPIATTGEFMFYVSNAPGRAEQVVLKEQLIAYPGDTFRFKVRVGCLLPRSYSTSCARNVLTRDQAGKLRKITRSG